MPGKEYRYLFHQVLSDAEVLRRRAYLPAGRHSIGAAGDAAIQLPVGGVSRRHAELEVLADGGAVLTVTDGLDGLASSLTGASHLYSLRRTPLDERDARQ